MELRVLGSGAFAPPLQGAVRNPSGYAVSLGARVLVFDLGFGNLRQLARGGLDISAITDVFFTHRHPDHCGDLAALLFTLRYDAKPRSGRLRLWGPKGLRRFCKEISRAWRPWLGPQGYRLELRELASGVQVQGQGWSVSTLSVPHPTPALAYRLEYWGLSESSRSGRDYNWGLSESSRSGRDYKGKSLVYSGDTGPSKRLAKFAAGADLFVLECTLPSCNSSRGHLNVRQALELMRASGCRKGLLSHVSGPSEAELKRRLRGGRIRLARDLMRVRL